MKQVCAFSLFPAADKNSMLLGVFCVGPEISQKIVWTWFVKIFVFNCSDLGLIATNTSSIWICQSPQMVGIFLPCQFLYRPLAFDIMSMPIKKLQCTLLSLRPATSGDVLKVKLTPEEGAKVKLIQFRGPREL